MKESRGNKMRTIKGGHQTYNAIEKNRMIEMARGVCNLIKILAGVLVLIFGWLKLHGIELAPIARELPASAILSYCTL